LVVAGELFRVDGCAIGDKISRRSGVRFRLRNFPKGMMFSTNFLRGVYTVNEYNPRRPNFFDLRAGFWYAFTH